MLCVPLRGSGSARAWTGNLTMTTPPMTGSPQCHSHCSHWHHRWPVPLNRTNLTVGPVRHSDHCLLRRYHPHHCCCFHHYHFRLRHCRWLEEDLGLPLGRWPYCNDHRRHRYHHRYHRCHRRSRRSARRCARYIAAAEIAREKRFGWKKKVNYTLLQ